MDIDEFSVCLTHPISPPPIYQLTSFAQSQVACIPGLTGNEQARLQSTLANVKRDFVRKVQTLQGTYVRSLEPSFRHDPVIADVKPQRDQGVTWICLPYFSLEPYSGLLGAQNTKSFPTPTLLQARYSQTTRERDMEQVVCQKQRDPQRLCFHVSQLWCLILDNCEPLLSHHGQVSSPGVALC